MSESWGVSYEPGSPSDDSHHFERSHIEPQYDAFVCPLTKQIMRDPVSLENGQTFDREAIEKWFKECKESGRKPICPLTLKELRSTELNPSIALRNTIEEWCARNEAAQLDIASRSLSIESPENDILLGLKNIQYLCQRNRSNKHVIRNAELIPLIVYMLKSSSRKVRCKALETLRIVAKDDIENKEAMAEGDTIRTIVKFLSNDLSQEREEAVSLLYELSKSESLCEKIGGVNGAILILVGMSSSKSENVLTVEKVEKTLENLQKCEKNVRQMAENGRLQPVLALLLEGSSLVDVMRSVNMQTREAALKALNQISSCEASAKVLIEMGILPPLVKDLFTVGVNQLPMRLKEVSATVLANVCAFELVISRVVRIRQGETRGNRFVTPYLEGLVQVLSKLTFFLGDEPGAVSLARENNLAALFTDLLQMNGLDKVFVGSIFPCFGQQPVISGLCRVHHGKCSSKESFCLLEGRAVGKLVACLDHTNEKVVEAALAALCTLLEDEVDIEQSVTVLSEVDGIKPIFDVLLEKRTEILRQRGVWAVERLLRTEDIAYEISGDLNVATALVDAFQHGDYRTRQIAEDALKHVDKIPKFSGIFQKMG
ncbi:U-box domain-containing protein 44-like protein [Cinnamomum micranthum f. kanehirae]|uniref:RING-type E3 ubiquitin transferase n=1 Tax=Cinnamomum micranthum f. kanehirae TaxID=337451 RepID=A0A3S3RB15_9MAGN|nr:U-box domain-containing protein 44-like protein [Cinnamomum micranthum f. kanehirae]